MVKRAWQRRFLIILALGACFMGVQQGRAQAQGAGGQIEGTVRDQQGAALPGATVTLRNDQTGVVRTAVTEADGRYLFPALAPGTFSVKVELQGFATTEARSSAAAASRTPSPRVSAASSARGRIGRESWPFE